MLYDNIIDFLFLLLRTKWEWVGKLVETKNTSTQTKKSWSFENTSNLTNIAQEDDTNVFELFQNLWIKL